MPRRRRCPSASESAPSALDERHHHEACGGPPAPARAPAPRSGRELSGVRMPVLHRQPSRRAPRAGPTHRGRRGATWPSTCGMGVAVMSSTWTERALAGQRLPVRDAEPVLLVDHREPQVARTPTASPMSAWVPTNTRPRLRAEEACAAWAPRPARSASRRSAAVTLTGQQDDRRGPAAPAAASASPRAGGPAGRWARAAPTGGRHRRRTPWPAPRPPSCPSRRRPGRGASSAGPDAEVRADRRPRATSWSAVSAPGGRAAVLGRAGAGGDDRFDRPRSPPPSRVSSPRPRHVLVALP